MTGKIFSIKQQVFIISIFITILVIAGTTLGSSASNDTVEYGDVVDVFYWLYLNPNYSGSSYANGTIKYIYVSQGKTVPPDVQKKYPDAKATYLEDFKTNLVGMKVGETKRFMIPAERGYTDPQSGGDLYNKDLYFQVKLLKIVYKAPPGGGGTNNNQDFFKSNSTLLLLLGTILAVTTFVGFYNYKKASERKKLGETAALPSTTKTIQSSYGKSLDSLKELSRTLNKTATSSKNIPSKTKIKPRVRSSKSKK